MVRPVYHRKGTFFAIVVAVNMIIVSGGLLFLSWPPDNSPIFIQKISSLCWIGYAPSQFDPRNQFYPSIEDIKADLTVLKKNGFNGVITFGAEKSLRQIPKVAKEIGFEGVIMGIWDPASDEEIESAITAKQYVDGYCVGHMGLNKNYGLKTLKSTITKIKKHTQKQVTTSEGIDAYTTKSPLIQLSDWIFPDSRIYWQNEKDTHPRRIYSALLKGYERLVGLSDKPVLLKIVGYPTKGFAKVTENQQVDLFKLLLKNAGHPSERLRFAYFEAFDQPWKTWHSVEAHWGVFNNDRTPKAGVGYIWGKKISYPYEKKPKNKTAVPIEMIVAMLGCVNAAAGCIYYMLFVRTGSTRVIIRLVKSEHKIYKVSNNQASEIVIKKTPQKCFDILLYFLERLDRPLMCGEIVKHINDKVFERCIYTPNGGCQEKRELCQSYRTLSNHRIGVIKKVCMAHEIGHVKIISGESKWKLTLAENVKIEIVD